MKLPKKIHRVTSSRLLCVLSESLRCLLLSPELIGASSAIASFQRFKLPPSRTNASIAKSTVTLCSTQSQSQTPQELYIVKEKSVSVVLLAGGQGKRMGVSFLSSCYVFQTIFSHTHSFIFLIDPNRLTCPSSIFHF
ncbi:hypothetical protein HN51_063346 [Arachis hypogaea]